MSIEHVQHQLADAYQLLSIAKEVLDNVSPLLCTAPYQDVVLARKNIRDALNLINDSEAELDDIVKEIDEHEEKSVVEVIKDE